jgi:hypothetical protein
MSTLVTHQRSEWATSQLREARWRISGTIWLERFWFDVLTEDQRQQVGGDVNKAYRRYGNHAGIWQHLHGISESRAVLELDQIFANLSERRRSRLWEELGETAGAQQLDDEQARSRQIAEAVGRCHLVLDKKNHEIFWEGRSLGSNWGLRAWRLLCLLAECGAATYENVYYGATTAAPNALAAIVSRLKDRGKLPPSLEERIVPQRFHGSYKLELDRARISIFDDERDHELQPQANSQRH